MPATLPVIGGQPLSKILPGGTGNCAAHDDKDLHQGVSGWWLYFAFDAVRVAAFEPVIFADGFEAP